MFLPWPPAGTLLGGKPTEALFVTAIFAHRGYTLGPIENTLEAFAEARRRGADGVEFDVRRSGDGALVVHHDAALSGVGLLCETPVSALPAWVPTLSSAIAACEGMQMNVEIKNAPGDPGHDPTGSLARAVAAELAGHGRWDGVIVSSFDAATIEAVRAAEPGLAVGWLVGGLADVPRSLELAIERGYQALHPNFAQVGETLVRRAHEAGLALNVWTPNHDADLEAAFALGVDTVITDRLEAALAIAARREAGHDGVTNGGEAGG